MYVSTVSSKIMNASQPLEVWLILMLENLPGFSTLCLHYIVNGLCSGDNTWLYTTYMYMYIRMYNMHTYMYAHYMYVTTKSQPLTHFKAGHLLWSYLQALNVHACYCAWSKYAAVLLCTWWIVEMYIYIHVHVYTVHTCILFVQWTCTCIYIKRLLFWVSFINTFLL